MADITVTEHLLLHQKRSPQATGQFTGLLYDLILSGKTSPAGSTRPVCWISSAARAR